MKTKLALLAVFFLLMVPAFALDILSTIPAEMDLVSTFDAARFFASPGFEKVRAEVMKNPERVARIEEFKKLTGIDPEKDIHSYHVFLDIPDVEPGKGEKIDPDAAIVVSGRVTEAKILDFFRVKAEEKGFKFDERFSKEDYKGRSLWKGSIKNGRDVAGVVIDGEAILMGKEKLVKKSLDLMGAKSGSLYDNKQMAGLIEPLLGRRAIWLVAVIPESLKTRLGENPKAGFLKSINSLILSLDFDTEMELLIRAATGGPGQAQELVGMLNGYKAMGAMLAGRNPFFTELLGALIVHADGTEACIDFRMSVEELKNIIARVGKNSGEMNGVGSTPSYNPEAESAIDPVPPGEPSPDAAK